MTEKDLPLTETMFYILLALRRPNHGYGIIQEVSSLTDGRVLLGAGTLYGAIQSMEKRGWIRVYHVDDTSRKKKEYLITSEGKAVFSAEKARLAELLNHAQKMEESTDA